MIWVATTTVPVVTNGSVLRSGAGFSGCTPNINHQFDVQLSVGAEALPAARLPGKIVRTGWEPAIPRRCSRLQMRFSSLLRNDLQRTELMPIRWSRRFVPRCWRFRAPGFSARPRNPITSAWWLLNCLRLKAGRRGITGIRTCCRRRSAMNIRLNS